MIQFIDASGDDFFKKETNNNVLTEEHITRIVEIFEKKKDVRYLSALVSNNRIADNSYNLSVRNYVEAEDKSEKVDIAELEECIRRIVARGSELRSEIDTIIAEIKAETI